MSCKMFMYFFLQSKINEVFNENIPGFVSIVSFNGLQTVEGQNDSFSAASRAINDTRRWIRVLSSETIGHLKKYNKCICIINHLESIETKYKDRNPGMFPSKTLISFRLKKEIHKHLEWRGGE